MTRHTSDLAPAEGAQRMIWELRVPMPEGEVWLRLSFDTLLLPEQLPGVRLDLFGALLKALERDAKDTLRMLGVKPGPLGCGDAFIQLADGTTTQCMGSREGEDV